MLKTAFSVSVECGWGILSNQQMPAQLHQAQISLHLPFLIPYTGPFLCLLSKYSFQQCNLLKEGISVALLVWMS